MAEKLREYEFRNQGMGGGSQYPWDEWSDGGIWRVKKGEDFTSKLESFRSTLENQAKRSERKVRANIQKDDDTIVFQFLPR